MVETSNFLPTLSCRATPNFADALIGIKCKLSGPSDIDVNGIKVIDATALT